MKCIFFNTLVLDRLLVTKLGCLMLKNQFLYALTRNSVGLFCRFFFIGSDMEVLIVHVLGVTIDAVQYMVGGDTGCTRPRWRSVVEARSRSEQSGTWAQVNHDFVVSVHEFLTLSPHHALSTLHRIYWCE
jgi:hypothetical protein